MVSVNFQIALAGQKALATVKSVHSDTTAVHWILYEWLTLSPLAGVVLW